MKRYLLLLFLTLPVLSSVGQDYDALAQKIHDGKEDEAIAILQKVEDKNSINYLNLLGEAYLRKGLYEEARETFEKAEYLQETKADHDELQLADTYGFIANLHYATGNNQLSLQYHFKALDLRQKANDIMGIAATTNDIGLVYSKSNPEKALDYYEKALEDYLKIYGREDERVVTAYVNIGFAHSNLGDYPAAHKNFDI